LKRKDIEQIIHNAYQYDDQEVINHLSKNQRIAGIMDDFRNMMSGGGFQTKQMPSGYQFENSADFTTFMGSAGTVNNAAVDEIIKFWRDSLKASAVRAIPIPALRAEREIEKNPDGTIKMDTSTTPPRPSVVEIDKEYTYQFKPTGYIEISQANAIWTAVHPASYNKTFGVDPATLSALPTFTLVNFDLGTDNNPSQFRDVDSGSSTIRFKDPLSGPGALGTVPTFATGRTYIKIESGGVGDDGYIEVLKKALAVSAPMDKDDNHALLIKEIGTAMSAATTGIMGRRPTGDRYFTSMLRQNSIGADRVQGLASTWNYIVGLPDLIQKRQGKAPGGILEYKSKLILKSKGIELKKLLDTKYEYTDTTGQKQFVRLADLNKLPKEYYGDVMTHTTALTDLATVGDCVAFIQQELDKDNSPIRKFIKDTDAYSAVFRGKPNIKL